MLLGINIWIKPLKFLLSIGIFSWTMAWFLFELPQKEKVRIIYRVIILVMGIELIIIIGQAARGELSHFNTSSGMNEALFNIMGLAIVINTLMVFWAFLLFSKVHHLPVGYKRGIRLGMIIFIIASLEGFLMVGNMGHTIGAPDGQEGLFFFNWAKSYGDLRIFHFFGLHALQAVPLFAYLFSKTGTGPVTAFALVYLLLSAGTLWNALAGKGLFDF